MDETVAEAEVGRVGGPGSLTVNVAFDLVQLRRRLSEADHPLAAVPQWNGERFYLVSALGQFQTEDNSESARVARSDLSDPEVRALLITARTAERAEEVARNNLNRRDGPTWDIRVEEVELASSRQLQHDMRI
jgi:hypothetical protein